MPTGNGNAAKGKTTKPRVPKTRRSQVARKNDPVEAVKSVEWPIGANGEPMTLISFTASELIPTGQYANVTVGPATATKFVETDDNLADHVNKVAEVLENDVIAVQRVTVQENLQADALERKNNASK